MENSLIMVELPYTARFYCILPENLDFILMGSRVMDHGWSIRDVQLCSYLCLYVFLLSSRSFSCLKLNEEVQKHVLTSLLYAISDDVFSSMPS